jgi:hypothetical protein
MSKTFRAWDVGQEWLLPASVQDFVPAGHPAHLTRDVVRETLDLGEIMAAYDEPRGYPPYHPAMMVALLLYAYTRGIYSSRRIAKACEEQLDSMAVTAMARPDFHTISDFGSAISRRLPGSSRRCWRGAVRRVWSSATTSRSTAPRSRPMSKHRCRRGCEPSCASLEGASQSPPLLADRARGHHNLGKME